MEKEQIEQAAKNQIIIEGWDDDGTSEATGIKNAFKAGVEWTLKNSSKQYTEGDLWDAWSASKDWFYFEDWLNEHNKL